MSTKSSLMSVDRMVAKYVEYDMDGEIINMYFNMHMYGIITARAYSEFLDRVAGWRFANAKKLVIVNDNGAPVYYRGDCMDWVPAAEYERTQARKRGHHVSTRDKYIGIMDLLANGRDSKYVTAEEAGLVGRNDIEINTDIKLAWACLIDEMDDDTRRAYLLGDMVVLADIVDRDQVRVFLMTESVLEDITRWGSESVKVLEVYGWDRLYDDLKWNLF